MNKSEAKFKNTAIKMNHALIELLKEKEFDKISILEICQKAGVNRSTFYSHYRNTYDLLEEVHQTFSKDLSGHFKMDVNNLEELKPKETVFVHSEYLIPYLEFIKDNKTFFKAYMSNLHNFKRDEFYSFIIDKVIIPICRKNGIKDRTVVDYISKFYLQGIAAIIKEWVNNDCINEVDSICEIIILCISINFNQR